MIFNPILFAVVLSVSAFVMSMTVLWHVALRPRLFERGAFQRGGIVKHEPTNILWLNGQRQMSEDIIALRLKIAALEMPDTQPTEAEYVAPHILRAQRLAITCLTRTLEALTAARMEVRRENDPA